MRREECYREEQQDTCVMKGEIRKSGRSIRKDRKGGGKNNTKDIFKTHAYMRVTTINEKRGCEYIGEFGNRKMK